MRISARQLFVGAGLVWHFVHDLHSVTQTLDLPPNDPPSVWTQSPTAPVSGSVVLRADNKQSAAHCSWTALSSLSWPAMSPSRLHQARSLSFGVSMRPHRVIAAQACCRLG